MDSAPVPLVAAASTSITSELSDFSESDSLSSSEDSFGAGAEGFSSSLLSSPDDSSEESSEVDSAFAAAFAAAFGATFGAAFGAGSSSLSLSLLSSLDSEDEGDFLFSAFVFVVAAAVSSSLEEL